MKLQQTYSLVRQYYLSYLAAIAFLQLPHTLGALFAGNEIEGCFQNLELVENLSLVLTTLYPTPPEFQTFQRLSNAN